MIEQDARRVAVLHAAEPLRRTTPECIALLPEDSTATTDPGFADAEVILTDRKPMQSTGLGAILDSSVIAEITSIFNPR